MSNYTVHLVMRLSDNVTCWEVRNRGRYVCDCKTQRMAQRIANALGGAT